MMEHCAKVVLLKSLAKLYLVTGKAEEVFLASSLAALAGLTIVNVVAREAGRSIYFVEEVSYFLIIAIAFGGFGYSVRKGRHIRVSALFDLMNEKIKKVVVLIVSSVSLVVVLFLAYQGVVYLLAVKETEQTSGALMWPTWTYLVIIPVGLLWGAMHIVRTITKNIIEKEVWMSPECKEEYIIEDIHRDI